MLERENIVLAQVRKAKIIEASGAFDGVSEKPRMTEQRPDGYGEPHKLVV
jgi:hypothetical protein